MENAFVSVNIGPPDKNGLRVCQLSDSDHTQHPSDLKPHEGSFYWASKNSCSSKPCGQSMPCINGFTDKQYICPRCQNGFMGERCEQDINECITNTHGCHHNASCNNTIGSYTCKCKPGLNCNQCRILAFPSTLFFVGERLANHTIENISVIDRDTCEYRCYLDHNCVSINFYFGINESGKQNCELNNSTSNEYEKDVVKEANYVYHGTKNFCAQAPCRSYGTCQSGFTRKRYRCLCPSGFMGQNCERVSFRVVFTNLNAVGRYGPTTLGDHYTGQDHDGQVTLSSAIQQWTVPYTGKYTIEAIGAAGGYDPLENSSRYRGRGTKMTGTFSLNKFEVIHILIGQEGGINNVFYSSGGGGGTFVVREASIPLIIAGGGGTGNHSSPEEWKYLMVFRANGRDISSSSSVQRGDYGMFTSNKGYGGGFPKNITGPYGGISLTKGGVIWMGGI
ncbi:Neurogenic locus notch-like protein 1 [Stylophora pistillata]|uniref:Neurogenic locus notch-like protein 1 n=1 Tax=Stylophora pistillata TaxID=50429 RepID=A0A2B4R5W3_STYPI|nr:Neurogenic locus notch-like protein 1 [Stylophora pistillata]